jgi:membrane protease YdiL (CAAX protease family)
MSDDRRFIAGSITKFVILTFAITWLGSALAFNIDLDDAGLAGLVFRTLLLVAGTFAPSLAAVALTAQAGGFNGVRALMVRLFQVRAGIRWYLFALAYGATITLPAGAIEWFRTGRSLWQNGEALSFSFAIAALIALPVQAGEEIGWRGYALPRLGALFGFAKGSLLLGVIWGLWHLPLYYYAAALRTYGQSCPFSILVTISISVAMAWLYVNTGGSLFLATLMHWSINQTLRLAPPSFPSAGNPLELRASPEMWWGLAVSWVAAVYFLNRLRSTRTTLNESR